MMIVFWALLIVMAVMLYRWVAESGNPCSGKPIADQAPEEIIKQRYAKGAINREEYKELRKAL